MPCLFTSISFYLFFNPNSSLYFSVSFYLFLSILRIATYIFFYLFSIYFYFFIPLRQSRLMPISFYVLLNPNSRLTLTNPFSSSHSILYISTFICFYLLSIHLYFFIFHCQSRLMPIFFNLIFFISA